ncbi:MAG: phosphodiesterase [Pirellulales bacterium]
MMREHVVLQFSDLHLFTDRRRELKEVRTWDRWLQVLADARARFPSPDLIVVTGDVAHDELPSTYESLAETLGDWRTRCRFLPGNHDLRRGFRWAFPELFPAAHGAGSLDLDAPLQFSIGLGRWRLIGLDTHLPGQVAGRMHDAQSEWLANQLRDFSSSPTLLFQHHPPLAVGTPWLDPLMLENPEALAQRLDGAFQVSAIFTGHVHQERCLAWEELEVFTTPSTAIQFLPGAAEFAIEHAPPGYRVIRLADANWATEVMRVRVP